MSVIGALPPDTLGELTPTHGIHDGFLDRILFTYPENLPRRWTEESYSKEDTRDLCAVFDALWELSPVVDRRGRQSPRVLRLEERAKQTWREWVESHYREQERPDFPERLVGPWAKLEAYCARLTLVLSTLRYVCREKEGEEIDQESVAGAWRLIDYFKSHARKAHPRVQATDEDRQVYAALNWVRKQPPSQDRATMVSVRQLQHHGVGGVKTAKQARRLLEELATRGYGSIERGERGKGRVRSLGVSLDGLCLNVQTRSAREAEKSVCHPTPDRWAVGPPEVSRY